MGMFDIVGHERFAFLGVGALRIRERERGAAGKRAITL